MGQMFPRAKESKDGEHLEQFVAKVREILGDRHLAWGQHVDYWKGNTTRTFLRDAEAFRELMDAKIARLAPGRGIRRLEGRDRLAVAVGRGKDYHVSGGDGLVSSFPVVKLPDLPADLLQWHALPRLI